MKVKKRDGAITKYNEEKIYDAVILSGASEQVADEVINEVREKGKEFYSDKCRERAVSCFNKDDRFKEYIDLFTNLINKK